MEELRDLIAIRPHTKEDHKFITNSWVNGLKNGCEYFRLIDNDAYFDAYGKIIHLIIERPATAISIACLKESTDIILGYSVTEIRQRQTILHWIYVKPDWRNNGLSHMLLPEPITIATHLTKTGRALLKKHPNVKFNPFII